MENFLFKLIMYCKCLSPPPYLKFTLSPMYKIKLKGKGKKKLTISTWNSSASYYRDDMDIIEQASTRYLDHQHKYNFLQLIIDTLSSRYHIIDHYQQFPSHDQLWCLLSSSYRADTNIIEHHSATCIPPIPSLLEPSGRDVSKQTTPKLVVCTELIV